MFHVQHAKIRKNNGFTPIIPFFYWKTSKTNTWKLCHICNMALTFTLSTSKCDRWVCHPLPHLQHQTIISSPRWRARFTRVMSPFHPGEERSSPKLDTLLIPTNVSFLFLWQIWQTILEHLQQFNIDTQRITVMLQMWQNFWGNNRNKY